MVSHTRRTLLLAGLAAPALARADALPNRPIRIVVPSAPGGSADTGARQLAERLSANTGRAFVVENRAGLAGTIGTDHVAKSAPDGTTFVFVSTNAAVNETLQPRRPFVLLRDLVPVAAVNAFPLVFAISPGVPAQDLQGFLAHARANPGALNFASSGPGSLFHLSTEVLRARAGAEMTHVPFRNYSEARTQTMGGQIHLMADATFTLEPLIRGGRLRGIATSGARRSPLFPELPTVGEAFPGYEFSLWNGLLAPAGIAPAVVAALNAEVNRVLAEPGFGELNARLGVELTPMSPEGFGRHIVLETERMRDAVRLARIEPE